MWIVWLSAKVTHLDVAHVKSHEVFGIFYASIGTSVTVLLFILVATGRLLFEELEKKLQHLLSVHDGVPYNENQLSLDVENWMRCYEMLRAFVDELNNNFGLIVLVHVTWIFAKSIMKFFEGVFIYAFIVTISLNFDLHGMLADVVFLEYNLNTELAFSDAGEIFQSNPSYGTLQRCARLERAAYYGLAMVSLELLSIWVSLLLILVPSYRMQTAVIQNSSFCFVIIKKLNWGIQGQGLFDTYNRFAAPKNDQLLLQVSMEILCINVPSVSSVC